MIAGLFTTFGFSILKLFSESLLSLYPVIVKKVKLPLTYQMWVRFAIYSVISIFFANFSALLDYFLKPITLLLAFVNAIHIFTTYVGFKILDSGVSYSIFYTYPILIILFSGKKFSPLYLLPFIGAIILSIHKPKKRGEEEPEKNKVCNMREVKPKGIKESFFNKLETEAETPEEAAEKKKKVKRWWGILAMIGSALTEVAIYFIVRRVNDKNSWNILLLAYFLPAIAMSFYLNKTIWKKKYVKQLGIAALANGLIGTIGYFLRFYTIPKLPANIYALLSYFGVIMAYVYGMIFNKERITIWRSVGSGLIILSGIIIYLTKK